MSTSYLLNGRLLLPQRYLLYFVKISGYPVHRTWSTSGYPVHRTWSTSGYSGAYSKIGQLSRAATNEYSTTAANEPRYRATAVWTPTATATCVAGCSATNIGTRASRTWKLQLYLLILNSSQQNLEIKVLGWLAINLMCTFLGDLLYKLMCTFLGDLLYLLILYAPSWVTCYIHVS